VLSVKEDIFEIKNKNDTYNNNFSFDREIESFAR